MSGLDWAIIVIYLVAILGIGLLFWWLQKRSKQTGSTKHFFTGGGKNLVWVVGISIFATITSSLFFLNKLWVQDELESTLILQLLQWYQ
ncbi:hypothetical protein [Mesomycoplasma hyorhinis]|uniref:hypothetical protein n=1 Tax=Mesomycoplasma hyorhinis TaxID=2100 RepID=UPI001F1DD90E|nr:hypothetical protein [Mesomycoplasma hyorhinis]